jgi:hypothetical protein
MRGACRASPVPLGPSAHRDRIAHLEKYIAEKRLSGTELGAEQLRPVKQKLMAQAKAAGVKPAARK